ncbi:MAG TPA: Dabb family protein [Ilumatobacteraceae bacterium]|jgi:hypothetical protein
MVRFVVTIKLKPDAMELMPKAGIDMPAIWKGLSEIDTPGKLDFHAGFDTKQHYPNNWSYAVVIDFTDFEAFDTWFEHPDHRRLGKPCEPFIEETSRVVFPMGDQATR